MFDIFYFFSDMQSDNVTPNKVTAFLIWLLITVFFCYQQILRILPNIICKDVMSDFGIGAAEFGSFAGVYYIGYIALHIPIGLALSKIGARRILPACIILTSFGLIPLIYNLGWNSVLVGRVLTGIGSSAAAVGALQVFRIVYPAKFAMMLGIMVSVGLITVVGAGQPLSAIVSHIGVAAMINILLYIGLALGVVMYVIMPRSTEEVSHSNVLSDIKATLFNSKLLFTSIFGGLMIGPVEGFADAWGSEFLLNVYNVSKTTADFMSLSVFLGMSFGAVILPYITDKTGYSFGVIVTCGIGMFLCFIYMLTGDANIMALKAVCIVIGVFSAYQVLILAKVASFVCEERSGMAGAIANMVMMTFGWFFHNMIGSTLDNSWDGKIVDGVRYYSPEAFIKSLVIIPNSMVVAVIGLTAIGMTIFIKARKIKAAQ